MKAFLNSKDSLIKNDTCKVLKITKIHEYFDINEFYQIVNDLNEFLGYFSNVSKIIMPQYSRTSFYKLANILCCKDYDKIEGNIYLSQIKCF